MPEQTAGSVPAACSVETFRDFALGKSTAEERARKLDDLLLAGVVLDVKAVGGNASAVRKTAHPFAPGPLHRERLARAISNQIALVAREQVTDTALQAPARTSSVAGAVGSSKHSASEFNALLELKYHGDIAGEPISLRSDEDAGTSRPQRRERRAQPRAFGYRARAAYPEVRMDGRQVNAVPARPACDGGELRLGAEFLFAGAASQIRNRDTVIAVPGSSNAHRGQ